MSYIIDFYLILPFWLRVSIFFFVTVIMNGRFVGKYILWCLSLLPFFMEKAVFLFYLLIEMPIEKLHSRYGGFWGRLDNGWEQVGEKVSDTIRKWYCAWHSLKGIPVKRLLVIYLLCVFFVTGSSVFNLKNTLLKNTENLYVRGEAWGISYLKEQGLYVSKPENKDFKSEEREIDEEDILLVVTGVNTSLLVRDVPSVENHKVLERLHNDDVVIWKGELIFSEVTDDIEPWVKIETENGAEGWTRLHYLYPKEYQEKVFRVTSE